MGDRRQRDRRRLRVPRRSRLGPGPALRPRPGPDRHDVRAGRRLPGGRGRLRRALLRDQPPRGAGDRSAAAAAAGGDVGGLRARGDRSRLGARLRHWRVRRRHVPGLRLHRRAERPQGGARGLRDDGLGRQHLLRAGGVQLRVRRARGDRGHGLLVLARRRASGVPGAALGRVLAGAGRRRDGDGDAGRADLLRASARPVARWALQGLRRGRGRCRLGRGRGRARARAALRRAAQRAPCARAGAWQRGQPGRRFERADGAERAVAGARDPPGAGERRSRHLRRGRRRGARHGHHVG